MAAHPAILAWEIPRTEGPVGMQPTGSQKTRTWLSDWSTTAGPPACPEVRPRLPQTAGFSSPCVAAVWLSTTPWAPRLPFFPPGLCESLVWISLPIPKGPPLVALNTLASSPGSRGRLSSVTLYLPLLIVSPPSHFCSHRWEETSGFQQPRTEDFLDSSFELTAQYFPWQMCHLAEQMSFSVCVIHLSTKNSQMPQNNFFCCGSL